MGQKRRKEGLRKEVIVREVCDWVERKRVEGWIIEVIQRRMKPSILSC